MVHRMQMIHVDLLISAKKVIQLLWVYNFLDDADAESLCDVSTRDESSLTGG